MKKLTAGIFATILGLTTVDAFAASVASTNYVKGAITETLKDAKAYTDEKVGAIEIPSLDGYATETWVDQQGYAVATTVATDIATAKSEAATDATSKANAAEAAAKLYADGLKSDIESGITQDLAPYAKTADVEELHGTQAHQIDALNSEITNLKSGKADVSELSKYVLATDVVDTYTK